MTDNARGYAYVALTKGYERTMAWDWGAALAKDGMMPSKYEYIEDGLRMYDQYDPDMDITQAKAIVDVIIKEMGRSMQELLKGKHSYPSTGGVVTRYDTMLDYVVHVDPRSGVETTLGDTVPSEDLGFAAVDDADEMRYRMRVLAGRLRPDDMATLASYVEGNYETLTEACGGKVAYQLFTRRMKVATRGMVMA